MRQGHIGYVIPNLLRSLLICLHWYIKGLKFSSAQSLLRWDHLRRCSYDYVIAARCSNLNFPLDLLNFHNHLAFDVFFFFDNICFFYIIVLIVFNHATFLFYSTCCFISMELLFFLRYIFGILFSTCRWDGRASTFFDRLFFLCQHTHGRLLDWNCPTIVANWIRWLSAW